MNIFLRLAAKLAFGALSHIGKLETPLGHTGNGEGSYVQDVCSRLA
jgi:hypothetical protein